VTIEIDDVTLDAAPRVPMAIDRVEHGRDDPDER
jgi:hypothetical protein